MGRLNTIRTGDPESVIEALSDREPDLPDLRLAMLNAMQRFEGVYRELAESRVSLSDAMRGVYRELAELRAEIEKSKGDIR